MRRSVAMVGLILILILTVGPALAGLTDPDQRIAFYKPRTGGPGTYVAWARLGQAYLDRGHATGSRKDLSRAEECLQKSLGYQANFEALRGLAALRLEQHRFGDALGFARQAVDAGPLDHGALSALSDALLALGQVDEAAEVIDGMLARLPSFEALGRRALLERRRGDLDQALDFMSRACDAAAARTDLGDAEGWCLAQRGELHRLRCEPELARQDYERALERHPDHTLTRVHLAELDFGEGRTDEALELYRSVLDERDDPQQRAAIAEVYAAKGDVKQAARERSAAVREMRRSAGRGEWTLLRPLAFLLLDDPKTVAEGLELAERDWTNRQDLLAADTLSWAMYRSGRTEDAVERIAPFLDSRGVEAPILVRAATMLEAAGRSDEARAFLDRMPACASAADPAERAAAATLAKQLTATNR
jgi:tetratricopeptide (TPR) repeat protein